MLFLSLGFRHVDKDNFLGFQSYWLRFSDFFRIFIFSFFENKNFIKYGKCAKEFSLETIVRMNSDAPFLDPILVDEVVNKFQENDFDFVSNEPA